MYEGTLFLQDIDAINLQNRWFLSKYGPFNSKFNALKISIICLVIGQDLKHSEDKIIKYPTNG